MMKRAIGYLRRDHPSVRKNIAAKAAAREAARALPAPATFASTGKSS